MLKTKSFTIEKCPKFVIMLYAHKQPVIEKMVSQNLIDRAIQIKDEIDYDSVKNLTKEHREEGSLGKTPLHN